MILQKRSEWCIVVVNCYGSYKKLVRTRRLYEKNVFDVEFAQKAIRKMIFVVNYGQFSCRNNTFAGTIDIDSKPYKVALEVTDNKITVSFGNINNIIIDKTAFIHSCDTDSGSSGSPIFSKESFKQ